jgi:proton glutamate symport protein
MDRGRGHAWSDARSQARNSIRTVGARVYTSGNELLPPTRKAKLRTPSLPAWIVIGMVAGIAVGILAPSVGKQLQPVSEVFLKLIKSIIAPLLFGTLVYGIAGTGSAKAMGRIGLKAVAIFEVFTAVALLMGLTAANLAQPSAGMHLQRTAAQVSLSNNQMSATAVLDNIFPSSIV